MSTADWYAVVAFNSYGRPYAISKHDSSSMAIAAAERSLARLHKKYIIKVVKNPDSIVIWDHGKLVP